MSTENTQTPASGGDSAASISSSDGAGSGEIVQTAVAADSPPPTSGIEKPRVSDGLVPVEAPVARGKAPVIQANTPAFTPNFKYKAALQEKELDPFFRSLIKDADSEKKVKDVFTRADAFDYMKDKFEKQQQSTQSLQTDYTNIASTFSKFNEAKAKKDYDSAFRIAGISDHELISHAAKKVEYLTMMNRLPPEQRQALEQQQQAVYQNQEYEERLSQMQSQLLHQSAQARGMHLDSILSRPEINQAAQFWDNKMGQSGAFHDLVVEEGQKEWHFNKVELTPEQAVQRVLQRFGKFIDVQGQQAPQAPIATQPIQGNQQIPQQRPVIPIVPGSSKAPIKKQFKSLDDLKKHIKELDAQDAG